MEPRSRSAQILWRWARTLRPAGIRGKGGRAKRLPRLLFFTDPVRTPDIEGAVARLPRGAGVVFRAFGAPGAVEQGRRLRRLAHARGLVLLAGADASLAAVIGADGVHLPERLVGQVGAVRRARPRWIVTVAAHSGPALIGAARAGAHAAVISPVFASRGPSAGRPLGTLRFAQLARAARLPVYALGGINAKTARRLTRSGAAGLAAVEALAT